MTINIFQIRPIKNEREMTLFCQLASDAFVHSPSLKRSSYLKSRWRWAIENAPDFSMDQIFAVFDDDMVVGGYQLIERQIRIRGFEILAGCISAVVTHPNFRRKGIASSLMNHAINVAQRRQYALLVLVGIPNFYKQFEYIDIFDYTEHAFLRSLIPDKTVSNNVVRLADEKDAEPLLELYQKHFYRYTGSFSRSISQQTHYLQTWIPDNAPVVCQNSKGNVNGYLLFPLKRDKSHAVEIVADNLEAATMLLMYHNELPGLSSKFKEIWWPMPSDSSTFQRLSDKMVSKGDVIDEDPARSWSVRSVTYIQPFTGWVARVANSYALMKSLLPLFRLLWQNANLHWIGEISLILDQDIFHMQFGETVNLFENKNSAIKTTYIVKLSQRVFIQLIFGYRDLQWAMTQENVEIPSNVIPVLNCLFSGNHSWIPGSDTF